MSSIPPGVEGAFQRRMVEGDIESTLPGYIRRNADDIDLIVWDLMIERVGVRKVRSGGMVTRNGVSKKAGTPSIGGAYDFGTEQHTRQWAWALEKFSNLLERTGLKDKTVINATPWATHDLNGEPTKSSSEMTPSWFNAGIADLWSLAEANNFRIARVSVEAAISDPNHKWGPAYFHYAETTYLAQLEAITRAIQ